MKRITTDKQRNNWDKFYQENNSLKHDNWLLKYATILNKNEKNRVLDIGCGTGIHIPYYIENGWDVTAIDYSEEAINIVKSKYPEVDSNVLDIRKDLPFPDNNFSIVVADLSLHYFTWSKTKEIMQKIQNIMINNSIIFIRVNSANDVNFGYGDGDEIEPGFFNFNNRFKRFFTTEMIDELIVPYFEIESIIELKTNRYNSEKWVWEVVARKQ